MSVVSLWCSNDVEDGDVESLCVGLASNRSVLEVAVGNSRLTDTSAHSFARMLKINTTLLALNITGKKPSAFNLGDSESVVSPCPDKTPTCVCVQCPTTCMPVTCV